MKSLFDFVSTSVNITISDGLLLMIVLSVSSIFKIGKLSTVEPSASGLKNNCLPFNEVFFIISFLVQLLLVIILFYLLI